MSAAQQPVYLDVTEQLVDEPLRELVRAVVDRQRSAGVPASFRPEPDAPRRVDAAALTELLRSQTMVSDIVVTRSISNCIAYNFDNVEGALLDEELAAVRVRIDALVAQRLAAVLPSATGCAIENTGHFWYPPGGYMGWHTNLRTPGWRIYVTCCDHAGRSFFRYRDPDSGGIVTSPDALWNARLFEINPARPFWHAVYSETNRFSFGYKVLAGTSEGSADRGVRA